MNKKIYEKINGKISNQKSAFTLAEVLITLGIIGVVAALVMPALIANVQDMVRAKRIQNIQQKLSKATDKMLSVSGLNGYGSTREFVEELKTHLSIAKVCENDDLRSCWPTEKVIIDDEGNEWEIAKTKKARHLKMQNTNNAQWDDTVGIITGDGTSMILTYNMLCDKDQVQTPRWSSDRSDSTNCLAAVYDWNGSSKPNKFGDGSDNRVDVLPLNAGGLGNVCAFKVNGKCLGAPFMAEYISKSECESIMGSTGIDGCFWDKDYWAGAVKQCGHVDNLPTPDDVAAIASMVYDTDVSSWNDRFDVSFNSANSVSLGLPSSPGYLLWSSHQMFTYASYASHFNQSSIRYGNGDVSYAYRNHTWGYAFCVLD